MTIDGVIGFVGCGNMARAIAEGILKKGLVSSSNIIVSSPTNASADVWKKLSIQTTKSNAEVINKADIIILAFKPHQLESALKNVQPELKNDLQSKLFVSILAGVPCEVLFSVLTTYVQLSPRLIRVMPNTLAMICEGCAAVAAHPSARPEDVKSVEKIFSALGKCEVVPEYLIPAVTGVSGSGPAYIYMVIEALSDGGVKQGLPRNVATTFAAQTVLGAAKMVLETKQHPAQLKEDVCSAGGTTIHAVHALEKGGLRATLMNAVEAAVVRGNEIAKMSKKNS